MSNSRNNINSGFANRESFLDLIDTPKSYTGNQLLYCQVNNTASGLQFAPTSGSGITKFVELDDVPSSYAGANNYQVVVDSGANALIFQPIPASVTEFIECTDTPMTYSGSLPYELVNINGTSTGVRFSDPAVIATNRIPLTSLQDYQSVGYGVNGQVVTSNGSTGFTLQTIHQTIESQNDYITVGYGTNGQSLVSNGTNGFTLQTLPKTISTQDDYLSSGYPTGILQSNGTNGFIVTNGNNNDVLQIVGGVPAWVPLSSSEIPDPLLINNIDERTLNNGVVIQNNTKFTNAGILYPHNTGFPFGSIPTPMNTYYTSVAVSGYWGDSATFSPMGPPSNIYVTKIGQMVFLTFSDFTSTSNFSSGASYASLLNIAQNGAEIPISTTYQQNVIWNNNTGGNNRNDAYVQYNTTSRLWAIKSTTNSNGGFGGGGFKIAQMTLSFLGSS